MMAVAAVLAKVSRNRVADEGVKERPRPSGFESLRDNASRARTVGATV
jgi:hypothetical protein